MKNTMAGFILLKIYTLKQAFVCKNSLEGEEKV